MLLILPHSISLWSYAISTSTFHQNWAQGSSAAGIPARPPPRLLFCKPPPTTPALAGTSTESTLQPGARAQL
ncbi:hypothetical protein EDC04DRAFT_1842599 [Pisolithus marmoratus]|nr:hypothetical protein EDC04DRAFT_1842599 [Pisolithus marmoratus]